MNSARSHAVVVRVITALALVTLTACAGNPARRGVAESFVYTQPLPVAKVSELALREKILYFTDQTYLSAAGNDRDQAKPRKLSAERTLQQLMDELQDREFVEVWTGLDTEFFGRVNQAFASEDHTRPQMPSPMGRTRDAYVLSPGHLNRLANVPEARARAMAGLIRLAEQGDAVSCLSFEKAYKSYRDPVAGAKASWLDVQGKPVLKSVWEGSAEAIHQGRIVQIPLPRTVVLGCRRITHIPMKMNPGVAEDAERYFARVNVTLAGFDPAIYEERKKAWLERLVEQAQSAASKLRSANIKLINVADIYQVLPPQEDYEYERAMRDGSFMDMVGAGILHQDVAFEVEQRVRERQLLVNGTSVSAEQTPLTLIYIVSKVVGIEVR